MPHFVEIDKTKRGNWSTKMTAAKKRKVIKLKMKLDMVRFENGDSKAKIERDQGLHETTG